MSREEITKKRKNKKKGNNINYLLICDLNSLIHHEKHSKWNGQSYPGLGKEESGSVEIRWPRLRVMDPATFESLLALFGDPTQARAI